MQDTNTFSLELYLVGRSLIDICHNKDTSFSNVLIAGKSAVLQMNFILVTNYP